VAAFAIAGAIVGSGLGGWAGASATPAAATSCATTGQTTCLTDVIITDHVPAPGYGAPFTIEDNQGFPPGHNAPMFWVDMFQVGSVNPVCSNSVVKPWPRVACLGGPPFDAAGGHPVVSLSPDNGRTWITLDVPALRFLLGLKAAGLTQHDIAWLHKAETIHPNW
jgi:hypothetical protein